MTELIEANVGNLSGEALSWAVAKAEGLNVIMASPVYCNPWRVFVRYTGEVTVREVRYAPGTNWADGGPLIEKHLVEFTVEHKGLIFACLVDENGMPVIFDEVHGVFGPTYLIAACRAIVLTHFGDTVQVPKELI